MRKILYIALLSCTLLGVWGCSNTGVNQSAIAVQTAKLYYENLIGGKYADFVAGTVGCDSTMDASYREQMVTNAQMFAEQMKAEHKGLAAVDTSRCVLSKDGKSANAFLILHFADSTKETIVVPMVNNDDVWYMK